MPEFVRVRDKDTGHELSVPVERVKNNPKAFTVLKEDAVNSAGVPLPPKYGAAKKSESKQSDPKSDQKADQKNQENR